METTKGIVRTVFIGFLIAVSLIVIIYSLAVLFRFGDFIFGHQTKPLEIYDADRIEQVQTDLINRSNELQSLLSQIQAMDQRIASISARNEGKNNWPIQDRADYNSLIQSQLDMITAYNRSCAQYNADWENWYVSSAAQNLRGKIPTSCVMYTP
ncbi:MAG: hypothetical protein ACOCXQ_03025 [Patescibacteria group bacterium]